MMVVNVAANVPISENMPIRSVGLNSLVSSGLIGTMMTEPG